MFGKGQPEQQAAAQAAPPAFPEPTQFVVLTKNNKEEAHMAHHCSVEVCGALHLVRGLLLSPQQPMPYTIKIYAPGEWRTAEGDPTHEGWKPESPLAI